MFKSLLKGIAVFWIVWLVLGAIGAFFAPVNASETEWMLMESPDETDMSVENRAYQINGFPTRMDCMEALTTYSDSKYRWCAPLTVLDGDES